MSENILTVKDISKNFPGVQALKNVSLSLKGRSTWFSWRKWGRKIHVNENNCGSIYT